VGFPKVVSAESASQRKLPEVQERTDPRRGAPVALKLMVASGMIPNTDEKMEVVEDE
jgi:hypothetical protein